MTKPSSPDTPNDNEREAQQAVKAEIDHLVADASPEQIAEWRALIERGWQEAQAGQLVDGPEFMGRLLRRVMEQTTRVEPPTPANKPPSK